MRHPRDPAPAHVAAECFGRLLATGLLDAAEVFDALRAAAEAAAGVDRSGLRTRLMHALSDSHDRWAMRRGRASARVRAAVAPLLSAWAPASAVLRAADEAGGDDLEVGEAAAIAARLAAAVLRRSA
jgi:hypothetical protein